MNATAHPGNAAHRIPHGMGRGVCHRQFIPFVVQGMCTQFHDKGQVSVSLDTAAKGFSDFFQKMLDIRLSLWYCSKHPEVPGLRTKPKEMRAGIGSSEKADQRVGPCMKNPEIKEHNMHNTFMYRFVGFASFPRKRSEAVFLYGICRALRCFSAVFGLRSVSLQLCLHGGSALCARSGSGSRLRLGPALPGAFTHKFGIAFGPILSVRSGTPCRASAC